MNVSFDDALEEYLTYIKLKRKGNTYETIERRIKKHIQPFFKNKSIDKIGTKDYLKWQQEIDKLNFKFNYKSCLHYTFSSFFEFCNKFYDIDNIAQKVGNFKNEEIEQLGNYWTIDEFKKFISVIDNKKEKIMFKLLFLTGLRKGELLGLTWDDIDFNNNLITVNKTITRKHELHTPKTKTSNRIICISKELAEELSEISKNKTGFIFNISFSQLKRKKDYYCDISGIKRIKIHEFRHSHAILLYQNSVPIDEISSRLGHSKISITTDIYLKYMPRNEKRVSNFLNTLIV